MDAGLKSFARQMHASFQRGDTNVAAKREEHANVECLRRIFAALAEGDFASAVALLTDDTEYALFATRLIPFRMAGKGRAEVEAGIRNNFNAVRFDAVEIETLVAQGDTVVVIVRARGEWVATSTAFDDHLILHYVFVGGKVAKYFGWSMPYAPEIGGE